MSQEILLVAGIGVFLLVAWTLTGWLIVRMGFTRDRDRTHLADGSAPRDDAGTAPEDGPSPAPVDPERDPDAIWRGQMKAATVASGARCACPPDDSRPDGAAPDPECPVHRWDFA